MSDPRASKVPLRQQLAEVRRRIDPAALHVASAAIAVHVESLPAVRDARTVALYQALRTEIQTLPLWQALARAGKRVLFPRVQAGSRVLSFAPVDDPAELTVGALGIHEPPPARDVPIDEIDVFVVPALGFDRHGRRLGRGGGYYDATLAAHPAALRVGPCLAEALVACVPCEVHDEAVDFVVTPDEVIAAPPRCR